MGLDSARLGGSARGLQGVLGEGLEGFGFRVAV